MKQHIHPTEVMKDEWLVRQQTSRSGELVVQYSMQTADQLDLPPFSHHILVLDLNDYSPRQVSRFNSQEFDGSQQRGDFWLLPAGLPSSFAWDSTDEAIMFILEPTFLDQTATETESLSPSRVELLPIIYQHNSHLEVIAQSFKQEITQAGIGTQLYIDTLATQFAIHLLRYYCAFEPKLKQYQGGLSRHRLQRALVYIQDHLADNISLAEIAQEIDMSQHHFCRLFKQSTGIAPYQYVIGQRVERAKQLLLQNQLSIAEVAQEVGFSEQSQLTRHLKRATGLTPKQLRG